MAELKKILLKFDNIDSKYRAVVVALFGLLVTLMMWVSDDAYHAAVMARNLVEGNGFVYNIGERVNAVTCPLHTLLVSGVYFVVRDMFLAFLIVNVATATIAFGYLTYKVLDCTAQSILCALLILQCYAVSSFLSAGLENSILIMLGIMYAVFLSKTDLKNASQKELFVAALFMGLLAFTRIDSVLLFIPAVLYFYLSNKKVRFSKRLLIGLAGLSPFIAWELFSIVYYGFFFPNTFYSKMFSGYPLNEYLFRGYQYYRESVGVDIVIAIIPIVLGVLAFKRKNHMAQFVFAGVVVNYLYIFYVGGDFMLGRFFVYPIMVSLTETMIAVNGIKKDEEDENGTNSMNFGLVILVALLVLNVLFQNTVGQNRFRLMKNNLQHRTETSVADERDYYLAKTGLVAYVMSKMYGTDVITDYFPDYPFYVTKDDMNKKGMIFNFLPGEFKYYCMGAYPNMKFTDNFALMDPLISRLPGVKKEYWRTGHIMRNIPAGYEETYNTGENRIVDAGLHEYYEKMKIIVSGPVWSKERFKTIWEMNLGKYDYLLENYSNSPESTQS